MTFGAFEILSVVGGYRIGGLEGALVAICAPLLGLFRPEAAHLAENTNARPVSTIGYNN